MKITINKNLKKLVAATLLVLPFAITSCGKKDNKDDADKGMKNKFIEIEIGNKAQLKDGNNLKDVSGTINESELYVSLKVQRPGKKDKQGNDTKEDITAKIDEEYKVSVEITGASKAKVTGDPSIETIDKKTYLKFKLSPTDASNASTAGFKIKVEDKNTQVDYKGDNASKKSKTSEKIEVTVQKA